MVGRVPLLFFLQSQAESGEGTFGINQTYEAIPASFIRMYLGTFHTCVSLTT
jgi:hypothetical protein